MQLLLQLLNNETGVEGGKISPESGDAPVVDGAIGFDAIIKEQARIETPDGILSQSSDTKVQGNNGQVQPAGLSTFKHAHDEDSH